MVMNDPDRQFTRSVLKLNRRDAKVLIHHHLFAKMQVHVYTRTQANTAAVARHTRLITALTVALTSSLHNLK